MSSVLQRPMGEQSRGLAKFAGVHAGDSMQLRLQKLCSFWFNAVALLTGVLILTVHTFARYRHTNAPLYYFRLLNYSGWTLLLGAHFVSYFFRPAHCMKTVCLVLGPWMVLEFWFAQGCDMSTSTVLFLPSFMVLSALICVGGTRNETLVYCLLSVLLAVLFTVEDIVWCVVVVCATAVVDLQAGPCAVCGLCGASAGRSHGV